MTTINWIINKIHIAAVCLLFILPLSQAASANLASGVAIGPATQERGAKYAEQHQANTPLQTANMDTQTIETGWRNKFLSMITDPNFAYILLLIGIYGIIFEMSTPGMVLPGVLGAICLLMALYAFQLLPVNYTAFALLILGIVFMIVEVIVSSFGIIGIGGIIAFVSGSFFLLDSNQPGFTISWQLILLMLLVTAGFFLTVVNLAVRSTRKKTVTGKETLIGKTGEVISSSGTEDCYVKISGEIWKACSNQPLITGEKVRVVNLSGLLLTVEPVSEPVDNVRLQ